MAHDRHGAVVVGQREGDLLTLFGDKVTIKLSGVSNGCDYSILETRSSPHGGAAPHVHDRYDLAFYIIKGVLDLWTKQETAVVGAGTIIYIPRKCPFSFTSIGKTAARFLTIVSPTNFEQMVREIAPLSKDQDRYAEIDRIANGYGMYLSEPE